MRTKKQRRMIDLTKRWKLKKRSFTWSKGARRSEFEENARRRKNNDIGPKCHVYSAATVL
jgi:hypothetical protein